MKTDTKIRSSIRTARRLAWVAALMLFAVAAAQASNVVEHASVGKGLGFAYDPAREVKLVGTVQELVTHPTRGNAAGLHLLVSASGKVVDAHLGPFISKENQHALRVGETVQIIGVNEEVHGKSVLLARQLVFGGREVTVRNERGFLVRPASHHKISNGKTAEKGGVQ